MKIITVILILSLMTTFAVLKYYQNIFFKILGKTGFLVLFITACVSIIFPNRLQELARIVGVGRGADLLLYFLTISTIALAGITINKVRAIEERFAVLVRNLALKERNDIDEEGDHSK